MDKAFRSLYFVRNQIPLNVRIDVFTSTVLSNLSFGGIILQTLTTKKKQTAKMGKLIKKDVILDKT